LQLPPQRLLAVEEDMVAAVKRAEALCRGRFQRRAPLLFFPLAVLEKMEAGQYHLARVRETAGADAPLDETVEVIG